MIARGALLIAAMVLAGAPTGPDAGIVRIAVDVRADRHPIDPRIYGVSFADAATVADLRVVFNRAGGNSASLYDWRTEARHAGRDWYFESMAVAPEEQAQYGDRFVARARGAATALTLPLIGWSARLDPDGGKRASFSIAKYGLQQGWESPGMPDAGNGIARDGTPIAGNDPTDAAQPFGIAQRRQWLDHLVARWGRAGQGGVAYYLMDNEPSRWHDIHRDVHPAGLHADQMAQLVIDNARLVKSVDPQAQVLAPEEWGWNGYRYSGFDQQIGDAHGYRDDLPDRAKQTHGLDLLPWLLTRWRAAGHPVDVVSVHYYPQGGEYGDDVSPAMQARRNRSTRSLWDPAYRDESWIADRVVLIPRLRGWTDLYYRPGTPIAITEYDWGAERHMNGATAQADILGIFGREGLAIAARWIAPAPGTPVRLAMKLFRNYDDHGGAFGETSVAARAPEPDAVAAFAALRRRDGALTLVVINKQPGLAATTEVALAGIAAGGRVEGVRLAAGRLAPIQSFRYRGAVLSATLPAQSVTLFVIRPDGR